VSITIAQICDAIATTLGTGTSVERVQSYNELTEHIPDADCPLLQVYFQRMLMEDPGGVADRMTFKAGRRNKQIQVNVDAYARQRSILDEDMAATVAMVDDLLDVFEGQDAKPFFGLAGIQSWDFDAERIAYSYAGGTYAGVRFTVTVWVY
jgi:hypothetical protein